MPHEKRNGKTANSKARYARWPSARPYAAGRQQDAPPLQLGASDSRAKASGGDRDEAAGCGH